MEIENEIKKENKILKQKDYKKHYKNFVLKNDDKIHNIVKCDLCGGHYTYFNKSRHLKTLKHKQYIDQKNII